ncbi:MAG: exported protein of unknown function [Candidatus Thorarchaeota archaeon]|nr:MAG: exported protein of unknown function [Candidatus Thorarchaeota archaeon]
MDKKTGILFSSIVIILLSAMSVSAQPLNSQGVMGPYVDQIIFKVISGENEQVEALLNDEVDIIGDMVDPVFVPQLQEDENIEISATPRNGYGYMVINCEKYPFNITAFRRAAAFALDKHQLCDDLWDIYAKPLDSPVPAQNPFSIEGQLSYNYYTADITRAENLLDAAGFHDIDDDGYREAPNGESFDITIEVAQSSSIGINGGTIFANALQDIQINATSIPTDFYDYLNRLYFHDDFDIVVLGDSFSNFDVSWLADKYSSLSAYEPQKNFPNFRNASYDQWIDQLLHGTSFDEVYEAAIEMQRIFVFECPLIILYNNYQISAYRNDRFEGIVNDAIDGPACWWTNYRVHSQQGSGGIFRWSLPLDIDTFNVFYGQFWYGYDSLNLMYDGLLKHNPEGVYIPWLAESYIIETNADNPTVPDGHTRFTFQIVNNATWSDGTPLTAQDVAFSYNFYREGIGGFLGYDLRDKGWIGYAPTDYTFISEFPSESYWHISTFTKPVVPKHIFQDMDPDNWNTYNPDPNEDQIITSGPFYLSHYENGEYTEFTANPYYFRNPRVLQGNKLQVMPMDGENAGLDLVLENGTFTSSSIGTDSMYLVNKGKSFVLASEHDNITLNWTSREQESPITITDGGTATGDQIHLNATYTTGIAENITMYLMSGLYYQSTKELVIPDSEYDPDNGTIDPSQFSWITIEGIEEDSVVRINCSFTNNDSDFYAWESEIENEYRRTSNNLLGEQMTGDSDEKYGEFQWYWSGSIDIACYCNDSTSGNWSIQVLTGDMLSQFDTGNSVEMNTYWLGRNETCDILIEGFNESGHVFRDQYQNIALNNIFIPEINLLSPVGGEVLDSNHTITWNASSRNVENSMSYQIFVSNDGGLTFQLIADDLDKEEDNLLWQATEWKYSEQYVIKVRVRDRGMESEDITNSTITAGNEALIDKTDPAILGPDTILLSADDTDKIVEWVFIDLNPDYRRIKIDDGNWAQNSVQVQKTTIQFDCEQFSIGMHQISFVFTDIYGNSNELTTSVTISANSPSNPFVDIFSNINPISLTITIVSVGVILVFSRRLYLHRKSGQS